MKTANSFALQAYRRNSTKYIINILWAMVIIQFPVNYLLACFKISLISPYVFLLNAVFLSLINLLITYLLKVKKIPFEKLKYYLLGLFILGTAYLVHSYNNMLTMHLIWVYPVMISALFFDHEQIIYTIVGSISGMLILDIVEPWNCHFPHIYFPFKGERPYFIDLYLSLVVSIICMYVCIYFTFRRSQHILENIDNTMKTVTTSTAMINHAIVNALINIKYGVELIESENNGNPELLKRTQIIKDETEHLETIVNRLKANLLDINIVEQKAVNFSAIINSCVKSYTELCKGKEIQITNHSNANILVDCDPIHFREVLSNFIKNAIEAIGMSGKISINAYCHGSRLYLSIADTGCGISEEELPHVTDPFITSKRSGNHLGLGLTYCYNIIKKHDGELTIDSKPGKGTTINVNLPQNLSVKSINQGA